MSEFLTFFEVKDWTMAGFIIEKLCKKYPDFQFSRSEDSYLVKIGVFPNPSQGRLNQMIGYAEATKELLSLFILGA